MKNRDKEQAGTFYVERRIRLQTLDTFSHQVRYYLPMAGRYTRLWVERQEGVLFKLVTFYVNDKMVIDQTGERLLRHEGRVHEFDGWTNLVELPLDVNTEVICSLSVEIHTNQDASLTFWADTDAVFMTR